MRDYGKVAPTFWTGTTGRELRADRDAQVVAMYLLTGPMANMIGLYHLPVALIADHTGMPFKGASKALRRVCDTGFSRFEGVLEHVFVPEMAAYQVGEPLSVKDLRVKGIISMWQSYRKSPFYMEFHARYSASFHLPTPSPFEGASKPLRSQEQEQEQDQDQEQEGKTPAFVPPTVEQVAEYVATRRKKIDPQRFVDHYTANGWVQGRAGKPVVDWQACVRTWEGNNFERRDNGKPEVRERIMTSTEEFLNRGHE